MKRILSLLWALVLFPLCGQETTEDPTMHTPPAEFDDEAGPATTADPTSFLPHDAVLELPEWRADDVRELDLNDAPTNLGGGLWPGEIWPLMPVPPRLPAPGLHLLTIPLNPPTEGQAQESIPAALESVYFGNLPPESVVDPQSLLNEVQQEELAHFFAEYASRQAAVQVRVLVLGPNQKFPEATRLQALADRWFGQQQGLVALYPMGQPRAAECYFSPGLQAAYAPEQLTAVREACVKEALYATREEDQLSRYGIKLAVRMNRLREEPRPVPPPMEVASTPPPGLSRRTLVLGPLALALLWMAGTSLYGRKRAPAPVTWTLPDQEMAPRLSAPHCGGTMALLKFR